MNSSIIIIIPENIVSGLPCDNLELFLEKNEHEIIVEPSMRDHALEYASKRLALYLYAMNGAPEHSDKYCNVVINLVKDLKQ